jgi:hypothetical protein
MKNKILLIFLISCNVFIGCNSKVKNENIASEKEIIIENSDGKVDSPDKLSEIWQNLPLKQLPVNDANSFDNIKVNKEFNAQQLKSLQIDAIYPNFYEENSHFKISPSYKIQLSEEFYTIVINVFKGEHELETILINYDSSNESLIAFKRIAYDEIAEGQSRKYATIEKTNITIIDEFYGDTKQVKTTKFHINKNGEFNPIKTEFTSELKENKPVLLNKIYIDTIQFSSYDDDYDYKLILGKKNGKKIALVYNWEWETNEKLNFKQDDYIKITWKMDSIYIAGDGETLDFKELAIDAEKINYIKKRSE